MYRVLSLVFCIATISALCVSQAQAKGSSGGGSEKSCTVQVREIAVKTSPNYLASTISTLKYGAGVEVEREDGNWYKIINPSGYIPKNATGKSSGSVDASQRYAATGVTHDETALAGKGFNPQVEGQYKSSSASLARAYTQVDKVERMTVSSSTLDNFITRGQLGK
jgi:hypothetical protein